MRCPLCGSLEIPLFYSQKSQLNWELYGQPKNTEKELHFFKCAECDLIFKDPAIRLGVNDEKSRYHQHNNVPNDPGYENFLSSLVEPIVQKIRPDAIGLDFGCGPEPVMESLFRRKGVSCFSYDPYFKIDPSLLDTKYDFITCSEAAEHFYDPKKEFKLLFSLLKPKAWLGIKTVRVPKDFASWWYHKDPTHVVFYSDKTFEWVAKKYAVKLELLPKEVALFQNN